MIDHLVVTAPSLESSEAWVQSALGVALEPGGEHPSMSTHNRLLRLGDRMYLEVLAPNPTAPQPTRPRWFALDGPTTDRAPRLAAWVARSGDIEAASSMLLGTVGSVETMSRGALRWRITIPQDGALILGGAAPALIQWETREHPASRLIDSGCALLELEIRTPDHQRIRQMLAAIGSGERLAVVGTEGEVA